MMMYDDRDAATGRRCAGTGRHPLYGRPTSILIAALDDLPVMRMTVSDADDPAAAKRARWARNSARRHRRRALGDCSDDHPDVFVLVCVRLLRLAPAPIEQRAGRPAAWVPAADSRRKARA